MGTVQSWLKSNRGEFERLENSSTPLPKKEHLTKLEDPRSPTTGVERTPIETNCGTPAKVDSESPTTHLLNKNGKKSMRQRLLERNFLSSGQS